MRKFGVLLLVLNHAVILLIPFMLGYYSMGRFDDVSYIGEYVHISRTGSISGDNIYPASLILGATLSIMSGLPANGAAFVMPIVFSFIFIGGLYLCCHFFLREEKLVNVAVLSSFIFYLGPYNFLNVPQAFFFAYMSLIIFILCRYIKKFTFENAILILVPTVLVPFMHPYIVLFVISTLLVLILFSGLLNRLIQGNYRRATLPFVILITGFLSWFIYCDRLMGNFRATYQQYLQKTTEPVLFETVDKLNQINVDIFKMTKLLTIYYGRYTIPLIIIGIALILVCLNKPNWISQCLKKRMYFILIFYVLFGVTEVVLFLNPMFSHQPDRMTNLNFMVYAQVPLFVLALSIIFADGLSQNPLRGGGGIPLLDISPKSIEPGMAHYSYGETVPIQGGSYDDIPKPFAWKRCRPLSIFVWDSGEQILPADEISLESLEKYAPIQRKVQVPDPFGMTSKSTFFNRKIILLLIILGGIWGLSLFGTFDSPNIFRANVALTCNEVEGMEWFYETRDSSKNLIVPWSQIERFHDLFDDGESDNRISIPDHFGYDSYHRSFADMYLKYGQESYVILLTYDELLYQEVPGYMEVGRYTAGDYVRFRNDQSVDAQIYDNHNIEIFDVRS